MKITYDPEVDAMRIKFQEGKYDISKEIGEGIIVDMTKEGKVLAIEMLDVSEKMPSSTMRDIIINVPNVMIENLGN